MAELNGVYAGYGRADAPFRSYAFLILLFNALVAGLFPLARRLNRPLPERVGVGDLLILGVATHRLSRIITKDRVTSVVRAPFTTYDGPGGPNEVNEKPRGSGVRRAIGELVTCPFCTGQWIAAILGAGLLLAPRVTRFISAIAAIVSLSDFLQYALEAARKSAEGPPSSDS